MTRRLLVGLASSAVSACVTPYTPPAESEPHAIVKLRRTYETHPGTSLTESVNIDDERALSESVPSRVAGTTRTDALLVRPTPATLGFEGTFSHQEMRLVQEIYLEQEPYTAFESYSCGSFSSPRTCSRSVTRYRSKSKTRYVNKLQTVVDGSCSRSLTFAPREDHVYLVQFTYQESRACSLSCFEQVKRTPSGVEQRACPSTALE